MKHIIGEENKMEKYVIIDSKMRKIEKNFLQGLGYQLIELDCSQNTYPEISSHVDIFCAKINHYLIVEKSRYSFIKDKVKSSKIQIIER